MDDYKTLIDLIPLKRYNHIAVFSQQVVEKLLKHIVYEFCVGEEGADTALNKHNLRKLHSIIMNRGIDLGIDRKDLTFIEDYYFEARYPGDNFIVVNEFDANECVDIVEFVKNKVGDFLSRNSYCSKCGTKLISAGTCPNMNCI